MPSAINLSTTQHESAPVSVHVYLLELPHCEGKQVDKLVLVLVDVNAGDLRQTLQRHIAKHGHVQKLH